MISTSELERLIAVKRLELEREKSLLGLAPPSDTQYPEDKENVPRSKFRKKVSYKESRSVQDRNVLSEEKEETCKEDQDYEQKIPPDLERYIRRYLGLPVMLKAGEYSPNNPLIRGERPAGDVLLGLGEYERQRNTLRRIRQQQYREYLDEQAKKKQEAKEQAERERRERDRKEREREEREREVQLEREKHSSQRRRVSANSVPVASTVYCNNKVDTAVQVESCTRPLSVAVQTDEAELFRLSPSPTKSQLTEAERELSPRTVLEPTGDTWTEKGTWSDTHCSRRRSYGDFDERSSAAAKNREKLTSDLRHTYMPSIFDADAIQLRNEQAEKEAAERRQYYQRELKNQILEQQRIKEERKTREKMLEQAEMRRIEEQLRMLRLAQSHERGVHGRMADALQDNTIEYNNKRKELQHEIDTEQRALRRTNLKSCPESPKHSKLPYFYPQRELCEKKPYSTNIPDTSIFSPNYDVDSYLRRNLNFNKDKVLNRINSEYNISDRRIKSNCSLLERRGIDVKEAASSNFGEKLHHSDVIDEHVYALNSNKLNAYIPKNTQKCEMEHVAREDSTETYENVARSETTRPKDAMAERRPDPVPSEMDIIPVLKHTPRLRSDNTDDSDLSEKMKVVADKWKVPAVQKHILSSMPNEEGKKVSILTQLGSIRRQLQLEQLKLDRMLSKDE